MNWKLCAVAAILAVFSLTVVVGCAPPDAQDAPPADAPAPNTTA